MITFNIKHLDTLHQQAHLSRDFLCKLYLVDDVPTKAGWLNMFAQALSYRDWGELDHLSRSYATNKNFLVFTPYNLPRIANRLRELVGDLNLSTDTIETILLSVATPEEKALNGVSESFSMPNPAPIKLVMSPEPFYIQPFLNWLLKFRAHWYPVESIEKLYLERIKLKRKGLSRAEIKENHYDIYPKSGQRVPDLLKALESEGFIKTAMVSGEESVKITDEGVHLAIEDITDVQGPKWRKWWDELRMLIGGEPYMSLKEDWAHYVTAFGDGGTPQDYIKRNSPQRCMNPHVEMLAEAYKALTNHESLPLRPTVKYFHFLPRLYLSEYHQGIHCKDLKLEIKAPNWLKVPSFKLTRYWPNKRYIGPMTEMMGFLSELPGEVDRFDIEFKWSSSVNDFPIIEHKITYILDSESPESDNWLFSTETGPNNFKLPYAFSSYSALTHGDLLEEKELRQLPRVKETMTKLSITSEGKKIQIEDEHRLYLSNQFQIHL